MYAYHDTIKEGDEYSKGRKLLGEFLEKEFGAALEADILLQPLLAFYCQNTEQKRDLIEHCLTARVDSQLQFVSALQALQDDETKQRIKGVLASCIDSKNEQQRAEFGRVCASLGQAAQTEEVTVAVPMPTPRYGPGFYSNRQPDSSSPKSSSPNKGTSPT